MQWKVEHVNMKIILVTEWKGMSATASRERDKHPSLLSVSFIYLTPVYSFIYLTPVYSWRPVDGSGVGCTMKPSDHRITMVASGEFGRVNFVYPKSNWIYELCERLWKGLAVHVLFNSVDYSSRLQVSCSSRLNSCNTVVLIWVREKKMASLP